VRRAPRRFGDGLTFDLEALRVRVINDALEYPGVNVSLTARLGASRATFPVDVSFGNAITPAPVVLAFPSLLLDEAVRVAAYLLETVVTEKFAALVEIGVNTTRFCQVKCLVTHITLFLQIHDKYISFEVAWDVIHQVLEGRPSPVVLKFKKACAHVSHDSRLT